MTEVKSNLKVLFIILHIVIATCSTKHWNQIHIRFGHWTQALKSVAQIMQGKDKKCINNSKALSIFYFSILSCNVTLLFAEQSPEVTGLRSLYMHTIIMKHVKWYFKFFRVEIYIVQIEFSFPDSITLLRWKWNWLLNHAPFMRLLKKHIFYRDNVLESASVVIQIMIPINLPVLYQQLKIHCIV